MRQTALDPTKAPWDEKGVEPACVLEIAWADGTAYYSTRGWTYSGTVIEDRIIKWSPLSYSLPDAERVGRTAGVFSMSLPKVSVVLRDDDRALWLKMRRNKVQGLAAKIYQAARGQDPTYFLLFEGVVTAPVAWERGRATLRLSPADHVAKRPVGLAANKTDFQKCWPPDVGKLLPIIFGAVKKVPAVGVQVGRKGSLRADVDGSATALLIDGFDDYDDSTVRLWIGLESLTGEFNGGKFVNVTRGGAVIASGDFNGVFGFASAVAPETDIIGVDNQYIGYWLKTEITLNEYSLGSGMQRNVPVGLQQYMTPTAPLGDCYRPIVGYQVVAGGGQSGSDAGVFYLQFPFMFEDKRELAWPMTVVSTGYQYGPKNGLNPVYVISPPMPHEKGEEVWEAPSGGIKYVVAGHACKSIRGVFGRGHKRATLMQTYPSAGSKVGGGMFGYTTEGAGDTATRPDSSDAYIEIPPSFYRVDLADTSLYPGHVVTTITFDVPVPSLPGYEFSGPEIFVDVEGWAVGGTLVENPVDALEDVLEEYADDVPLNAASFSSAASSVDWLKCAFALTGERLTVAQLATALAVQCRCRAVWIDGELHVEFLRNCCPSIIGRFYHSVVEGSHRLSRRQLSDIVTELEYSVTTAGDRKLFKKEDQRAITRYGRRGVARLDFWLYQKEVYADAVAEFWLHRLKFEAMRAKVHTPLTHIKHLPGDWMKLYVPGILQPYKRMEIVSVEHDLGGPGKTPSIMFEMIEPYGQWARSLSYLDGGGDGNDSGAGSSYGGGTVCPPTWACPSSDVCVGCDAFCDAMDDVLDCAVIADIQAGEFELDGCAAVMDTCGGWYDWNQGF